VLINAIARSIQIIRNREEAALKQNVLKQAPEVCALLYHQMSQYEEFKGYMCDIDREFLS
jgi:hypothetical protein